jgi:F-type H+-transporting ATPase subunit a
MADEASHPADDQHPADHPATDHSAHDEHAHDPLDTAHLMDHVQDQTYFEVPRIFAPHEDTNQAGKLHIYQPAEKLGIEGVQPRLGIAMIDQLIKPLDGRITKFMVIEVVAAVLIAAVFIRLGQRVRGGGAPKGKLWNLFEAMLLFIRDQVARPAIGHRDADRFLPFLWTVFFFVLACNLLGMVPWMGSPTGSIAVTGILALITFITVVGAGMFKLGPLGFLKAQVPHMDLPLLLAIPLVPMIFLLEMGGMIIKHVVLSVRLLANMMAGHLVLAVLIAFIAVAWKSMLIFGVMPASILGATALSMLELFVAFLQAYIFTFLSALFIGMAVHPH